MTIAKGTVQSFLEVPAKHHRANATLNLLPNIGAVSIQVNLDNTVCNGLESNAELVTRIHECLKSAADDPIIDNIVIEFGTTD